MLSLSKHEGLRGRLTASPAPRTLLPHPSRAIDGNLSARRPDVGPLAAASGAGRRGRVSLRAPRRRRRIPAHAAADLHRHPAHDRGCDDVEPCHRFVDVRRARAMAQGRDRPEDGRGDDRRRRGGHRGRRVAAQPAAPRGADGPDRLRRLRHPARHDRRPDAAREPVEPARGARRRVVGGTPHRPQLDPAPAVQGRASRRRGFTSACWRRSASASWSACSRR